MATATAVYTAEQSAELVAAYKAANTVDARADVVQAFAIKFGKSAKSIIAKLSREQVYVKKEYTSKTGEKVAKKDSTADAIGKILGLSEPDTESLTKANKKALEAIFKALANSAPL